MKNLMTKYNNSNTLGIISSFPVKNGEIARGNAISRYTYLLSKSFPLSQKLVIFCEKRDENDVSYELTDSILIVPTYISDSLNLPGQIFKSFLPFSQIKDVLIQFEFSIFGGKKVIPGIVLSLLLLKALGKNINFVFHQVVTNLNDLSGHLGLSRNSFQTEFFNILLNFFYALVGVLSNKLIVHDNLLKERLSRFVSKNKIAVIPHAIGDEKIKRITSKLKCLIRKEFGLKANDNVITVYGYRSWYKGTDWIVRTIKELSDANPAKNLKLLVAGGISPTLKNTNSYKNFDRRLKRVIKKANGSVKVTGFIPEKDVWKVFAASNLIIFPYRTRMSASGAFSLTLAYKVPYLVSTHFAAGSDMDFPSNSFELNAFSFEKVLFKTLESKRRQRKIINLASSLVLTRSWKNIANLYLKEVKNDKINLNVNQNFAKTFSLAKA